MKPDPSRAGRTFNEGVTRRDAMSKAFAYAHSRNDIVWMAQNTNHLPTHPAIEQAIRGSTASHEYNKYPLAKGLPRLRELILEDLGLPDAGMHITNGGTEALYCLMRYLQPPGSRMITSDPSYFIIHKFAKLGGAECTDLPIYGGSCRFDLEAVRAAITPETKSILLIDPLNPLGSTYPRDEVRALCELATEHDLWIIDDITYRDFAPEHTLATEFAPERTIIAYSVSKNCGLAGLRVGALVGPQEFIDDIAGHMVSDLGISIVGQRAAIAALETKPEWLSRNVETCRHNQTIIKAAVDQVEGAYLPVYPSAASMMVIDIAECGVSPQAVQDALLYNHQVFVRAGNYVSERFGDRFVRVSFSLPTPEVEQFAEHFPRVMERLCNSA